MKFSHLGNTTNSASVRACGVGRRLSGAKSNPLQKEQSTDTHKKQAKF